MVGNKASICSVAASASVQQLLLLFILIREQITARLTLDPARNRKDAVTRPSSGGKAVRSWENRARNFTARGILLVVSRGVGTAIEILVFSDVQLSAGRSLLH